MSHQPEIAIQLYRSLLRTAFKIEPLSKRQYALHEIKTNFRSNRHCNQEESNKLLHNAYEKLQFMRMLLPPSESSELGKTKGDAGTYVYKDGEVIKGRASKYDKNAMQNTHSLDPDDLKRHEYLLRRQHFLEPPPPEVFEKDR